MFAASLCNMFLSLNTLFYLLYLNILNDLSEKPAGKPVPVPVPVLWVRVSTGTGTGSSPDTWGLPVTIPIAECVTDPSPAETGMGTSQVIFSSPVPVLY